MKKIYLSNGNRINDNVQHTILDVETGDMKWKKARYSSVEYQREMIKRRQEDSLIVFKFLD